MRCRLFSGTNSVEAPRWLDFIAPSRLGWFMFLLLLSGLSAPSRGDVALRALSRARPEWNSAVGSSFSGEPEVSADGRFVVFESAAANLTPLPPAEDLLSPHVNVYVRDLVRQTTELVSVARNGTRGGKGDSTAAHISADGRFVVYQSDADDLVEGDTNGLTDIFLRDRQAGQTRLVSVAISGGMANGPSSNPMLTPDGRVVAFESSASNLVLLDNPSGLMEVFTRDLQLGATTLVSAGAQNAPSGLKAASQGPLLSADGEIVVFCSTALFPALGLNESMPRIFISNRKEGTLEVISSQTLKAANAAVDPNYEIYSLVSPSLSADGGWIACKSASSSLDPWNSWAYLYDCQTRSARVLSTNVFAISPVVPDSSGPVLNSDGSKVLYSDAQRRLRMWDQASSQAVLVSVAADGSVPDGDSDAPAVSADGQRVAFVSDADNLVAGATNRSWQVYLRDLSANRTFLLSVGADSQESASVEDSVPAMSADAQVVAFAASDGLVPGDNNREGDVYVRDLTRSTTVLVSARFPLGRSLTADASSVASSDALNSTGTLAAFRSQGSNLVPNDQNGADDLFAFNLIQGQLTLLSGNTNGLPGNHLSYGPVLSRAGNAIAFASQATDLTKEADTNSAPDLFWREVSSGLTKLITVCSTGARSAFALTSAADFYLSLSADGRRVAFVSAAFDLVAAGNSNPPKPRSYLWDSSQEKNIRLEMASSPTYPSEPGRDAWSLLSPDGTEVLHWTTGSQSIWPTFIGLWTSADGDQILFDPAQSGQTTLIPPPASVDSGWQTAVFDSAFNQVHSVLWLRLADGLFGSVSALDDRRETTNTVPTQPRISGNGRFVVFAALDSRYPGGTTSVPQIYRRDLQTSELRLISVNAAGNGPANGASSNPVISEDGRYVAFQSDASDLVTNDLNRVSDVFVRDLELGSTVLISSTPAGRSGNHPSILPAIDAAGQTITFTSLASDLVPGDFNATLDVYVAQLDPLKLTVSIRPPGEWLLSFPTRSGSVYQLQVANDLASDSWSPVQNIAAIGPITTVPLPAFHSQGSEFYRIQLLAP